ncbi:GerAB/ArcD/ProY family transporter [Alicyclobacillus macrosporangiidus]|uniref:GerAB/ArcD/ProY family transporter n=1 Tax=Alicyclobacillus macrosporangiidus TaxID=392015 RepID=UPI0004957686|nr:endospore germination permease [Alicyclobacillus macrosporangiidus]
MPRVQEKARVGAKELTAMMTVLVAIHVFLDYPAYVSKYGLEAAWMEPVISGVVALILFLCAEMMLRRYFPNDSIVEVVRGTLGPWAAGCIALVFAAYLILITASIMREFMENVITSVLPATPILVVGGLFILTVGYMVHTGLEGIARVSTMAWPVLVLGVLALCLLTINYWHPYFLVPFWGKGPSQVLLGSVNSTAIFLNVLLLCVVYPHAHNPRDLRRVGVISTIQTVIVLTGFILCYHMVFAPEETTKLASPMYAVARLIHIGHFVQRLESVFVFMWVSAAVVKLAITLWSAAYLLAAGFGWPTYRPLLPALCMLCLAISLLPHDVASAFEMHGDVLMRWGWIISFAAPLLLLGAGILRRRRERTRRA